MPKIVNREYVEKRYSLLRKKFFPGDDLPDFKELDFEFGDYPEEFGHVDWDEDDHPSLSLHPILIEKSSLIDGTLLHEMVHIKIGSRYGHGRRFHEEAVRIMNLGGTRHCF
jgi:hypothetical protein